MGVVSELKLEPLERLDLRKCTSVGDIVLAMNRCSFGARMLGEVALKMLGWIQQGKPIRVVYDGKELAVLLKRMQDRRWVREIVTSAEIQRVGKSSFEHLIVGRYSEVVDADIHALDGAIFINKEELARPGQIRDGYFPDAVFGDPAFILPVLECALTEWTTNRKQTVDDLFDSLDQHAFGRVVVDGARTLQTMVEDPGCAVFLTLSGAMTIAKMGLVICDMVDYGMVQVVSSTGALMAHGLIEGVGLKHYKHNPGHSDQFLADRQLNRVTDTLEPEENFSHIEEIVDQVLWTFDADKPISPITFHDAVGKVLAMNWPELDSALLVRTVTAADRIGSISLAGGVPRHHTQNVAPLIEIANERLDLDMPTRMFSYGCRIAPDAMHYGHLSGCTYSENGSWRKMDIQHGHFAEIRGDATQVWPFLVRHVMERLSR